MSSPQHALYLPRMLLDWLRNEPDETYRTLEGTVVFADVSGFTALTESLAAEHGKGGAEQITRIMNEAFTELVDIVFMEGGDLLRYGGDALFCFFDGEDHAGRAARAAIDMGGEITEIDAGEIDLGISIGLAAGQMDVAIVGTDEREMFFSGPAVEGAMAAESAADRGQVFAPPDFASALPGATFEAAGDFVHLIEEDPDTPFADGAIDVKLPEDEDYSTFVSADLRARLTLALVGGENRPASIGFVVFREDEELPPAERVAALDDMFRHVRTACDRNGIAYLGNDVYPSGGKLLVADGVPGRSAGSEGVAATLFEIVKWQGPFALHAGCARGYVFAGDLGAPNRRAYTVMADTANLAARLASAAADGQVFVTEAALERSRGSFNVERAESLELKGKSMAVAPFRILGVEAEAEEEAEIPLFGREAELAELRAALVKGVAGTAGVVTLTASLGLGKGLLADSATEGLGRVVAVRSGRETSRGAGFLSRLFEQLIEIDDDGEVVTELEAIAERSERTTDDDVELLLQAVGVATAGSAVEDPVDQVAVRLGRVVGDLLEDLVGKEETVFRFENAGEASPAAKGVIAEIAERSSSTAWAVLVISDSPVDWIDPDVAIELRPFDPEKAHAFVRLIIGDASLPAHNIDQILERAMGNPYVLQELTTSALAGGEVPQSIEAAAVAKMDRLDPRDEQLLCLTAVLGNEARIELLTAVLPDPALAEDASSWARLQDFVDTSTVGKIRFREPVLRDAAYGLLPSHRRREAHLRVATTIEQRARRRPERYAGELAYHFHRADDFKKSWEYSQMAAQTASRRLDLFGSVQAWRQALEAADHISVPKDQLATAEEGLGDACEAAAFYNEAVEAYAKAGEGIADPAVTARLNHKIGLSLIRLGKADEARSRLEEALEQAEAAGAEDIRLHAMVGIAGLEIRRGQVEEAGKWCDRVIAEGDVEANPSPVARAYYIRSLVSGRLGRETALEEAQKALDIYESLGDKIGAANALNNLGTRAFYTGAWEEAEDYHKRNLEARRSSGDVLGAALAGYNLGELYLEQGRYVEAQSLLERTLADFRGSHHQVGEAATRLTLGRLATRLGHVATAENQFDRAQQIATDADAGEQITQTTLGRAELALARGEFDQASELLTSLPQTLTGPNMVRRHLLESAARFASGDESQSRKLLDKAESEAADVGAKHLEFAAIEMRCRLFAEGDEDADSMATALGMLARPVFRIR